VDEDRAGPGRRRLYGRRQGRKLRPGRQALLDRLLPRLCIEPPPPGADRDPRDLFASECFDFRPKTVWIEVGFGAGEHLAAQARTHPEIGLIGCEPYLHGIAALLGAVDGEGLDNIRLYPGDAADLIDGLAEASVGRLFVLFPDPWPKTRHHKRRFVRAPVVAACARVLADGAEMRLATDHAEYCRWMLAHMLDDGAFEWLARGPEDWRQRPQDWPETRYEAKARAAGARPMFLRFRRRARVPTGAAPEND